VYLWSTHSNHKISFRGDDIATKFRIKYLKRHVAIPGDHGSWVFLLSPLLIGVFAGESWPTATSYLILAALAVFLARQPITMMVKAYSGRRSQRDLPAARLWLAIYATLALIALSGLVWRGYGYLLLLAIPGVPVFVWYLYLVSRRAERRQAGVEVVASGVLALVAPAAFWVGKGSPDPLGWWLFALSWFQSAASIVYAYLRLQQRELIVAPPLNKRIRMGARAWAYTSFNLSVVLWLSLSGVFPRWLFIPYALQWLETMWGILKPAVGIKPTKIGFRQLGVSTLFTILFILTWRF